MSSCLITSLQLSMNDVILYEFLIVAFLSVIFFDQSLYFVKCFSIITN